MKPTGPDDRGAIMLIAVLFAVFAVALLYTTLGTAQAVLFRERMQDATDAAALSGAVMQARGMNLLVLLNIVMAALLAILVTIKLVEALAIIGMAIAAGLAWVTGGASLAAVPPLKVMQAQMHTAYEEFKPPIDTALEALHDTADVVQRVAPEAANTIAHADIEHYWTPPVDNGFVTARQKLPVTDGDFSELCGQAGRLPGELVQEALAPIGVGAVVGRLTDAMGGMANDFSEWFCGEAGNTPPSYQRTEEVSVPSLDVSQRCKDEVIERAEAMSAAGATSELCIQSERSERQAIPDAESGGCQSGADCSISGPYEERVRKARIECDPSSSPRPYRFEYQERSGQVNYIWTGKVWKRDEARYQAPVRRTSETYPPCADADVVQRIFGVNLPVLAEGYNPVVRRGHEVNEVLPVCSTETVPPAPAAPLPAGTEIPVSFKEVTHILGCRKKITFPVSVREDKSGGDGGAEKTWKDVEGDASLGDESFQVRALVQGDLDSNEAARIVRLALWGQRAPQAPPAQLQGLRGYAVAQAEYFYDAADERGAWMWNMKWRARLRRFRLSDEAAEDLARMCRVALSGERCQPIVSSLRAVNGLIAH